MTLQPEIRGTAQGGPSVSDYPFITLRVVLGPKTLLGSGKADLLAGIAETGSIAAASRRMGMSYKRAWYLIDTLNGYFKEPLVASAKGGRAGGGASLTDTGRLVLGLYRRVQENATEAAAAELHQLAALLAAASG
jgi:molybdate transport system regulatory protein